MKMKVEERLSKGDATRGRILEVAEKVFAEAGYAGTRLDDIGEVAGIKRTTILHYFNSKQDLYDRVEASIFEDLTMAVRHRLIHLEDPLDQLLGLFDSWLDFHVMRPTAARIILRNTADEGPSGRNPVQFSEGVLSTAEEIIRTGQGAKLFQLHNPVRIVTLVGGAILQYVCLANELGEDRKYEPGDPVELEKFRLLIHRTVRTLLLF